MTEIAKIAKAIGVIPESAATDRKGRSSWSSDEFALSAILERQSDGRIGWHAFVGDRKLGPALLNFGALSVAIDPATDDAIEWPTTSHPPELVEDFLRDGVGAAQRFVVDRLDLAQLLASQSDVRRADLTTWLPLASYPARLVQALILARDSGSVELETKIQERLTSGPVVLPGGQTLDIVNSAQNWAKQYAKALGREVKV